MLSCAYLQASSGEQEGGCQGFPEAEGEEGPKPGAAVLPGVSLKAVCARQERSALKAQKQEEKASQKASKEAAKALLKQEKDRVKFEENGSRGNSVDRSGSRRLLMRRQASVLVSK